MGTKGGILSPNARFFLLFTFAFSLAPRDFFLGRDAGSFNHFQPRCSWTPNREVSLAEFTWQILSRLYEGTKSIVV